jgi:hypothetical protein
MIKKKKGSGQATTELHEKENTQNHDDGTQDYHTKQ